MARQNIEDQFWLDAMAVASGRGINVDLLSGNALRFQRYAQELYKNGRMMTKDEFLSLGFLPELIPVFARETAQGIECVGAGKHFAWLLDKSESGRAGGLKSSANKRKAAEEREKKKAQAPQAKSSKRKHSQPSPSPSLSTSYSFSSSDSLDSVSDETASVEVLPTEGQKAKALIARYCDAWKEKHNSNKAPPIVGKDAGIFGRLLKSVSQPDLERYLDAYFQMPDAWVMKAKHPIELFESKLKEIAAYSDSGVVMTRKEAQDIEAQETLLNQLDRLGSDVA